MEAISTAVTSVFWAAWILSAIYFAIATAHLAVSKGYGAGWFLYGLLFGFFAFLHIGFMPQKQAETTPDESSGSHRPSTEDNELTKRLVDALERQR